MKPLSTTVSAVMANIIHIVHRYPPARGGAENHVCRLGHFLTDRGHRVRVETTTGLTHDEPPPKARFKSGDTMFCVGQGNAYCCGLSKLCRCLKRCNRGFFLGARYAQVWRQFHYPLQKNPMRCMRSLFHMGASLPPRKCWRVGIEPDLF